MPRPAGDGHVEHHDDALHGEVVTELGRAKAHLVGLDQLRVVGGDVPEEILERPLPQQS
jgi:hypothetical protein